MIRAVAGALVAALVAVLAACGVSLEDHPQRIEESSIQQPDRAPKVSTARPAISSTTSPPATTTSPPPSR